MCCCMVEFSCHQCLFAGKEAGAAWASWRPQVLIVSMHLLHEWFAGKEAGLRAALGSPPAERLITPVEDYSHIEGGRLC